MTKNDLADAIAKLKQPNGSFGGEYMRAHVLTSSEAAALLLAIEPNGERPSNLTGAPLSSANTALIQQVLHPTGRTTGEMTLDDLERLLDAARQSGIPNPSVRRGLMPVTEVINEMREIAEDLYLSNKTTQAEDEAFEALFDAIAARFPVKAEPSRVDELTEQLRKSLEERERLDAENRSSASGIRTPTES